MNGQVLDQPLRRQMVEDIACVVPFEPTDLGSDIKNNAIDFFDGKIRKRLELID